MTFSLHGPASAALVAALLALPVRAQAPAEEERPRVEETVEVPGRLGTGGPQLKRGRAVSAEQVEGERIRESGARSLPEFLASLPSITAVDETGNGRQLSIDLRGFAATPGATAFVVDGVRLNDPDTGAAAFELVRPIDVELVELRKGPLGPLLGGGSLAGGVQVRRRPASATPALELELGAGDEGLAQLAAFATGPAGGGLSIAGSASLHESGAPREGESMSERAGRMQLRRAFGGVDLALDASLFSGDWDQPGALTRQEIAEDPRQSVWNELDASELEHRLVTLSFEREGRGATDLRAVLARVDQRGETLSTGRSGYGFLTKQRTRSWRLTAEGLTAPAAWRRGDASLSLRWGAEANRDRLSPEGWATTEIHDGGYDDALLTSDVAVEWDGVAAFAGVVLEAPAGWTFEAGLRHDRSRVRRSGFELDAPGEAPAQRRSFSDTTWGAGLARRFEGRRLAGELRGSWSQSFLAPSSLQLFAFPGYFANPELEPQRGSGLVIGGGLSGRRFSLDLELFRTVVDEEIVFDEAARRNLNAGRTRRQGAELRLAWHPHAKLELRFGHAWTEARFESSWNSTDGAVPKGSAVPLVAPHRSSLQLDWRPAEGWRASLSWRRTAATVASNDFDNSAARVPDQQRVGLELGRELPLARGTLALRLAVENLLDELVVTRGIESGGVLYLTPAPPRTLTASLGYRF